ncbi:MAG: hypothetical protein ACOC2U_01845, partial [bacterium]
MAYSTQFYCRVKDRQGKQYRIEIEKDGFSDSQIEISKYSTNTFNINYLGGKDDKDNQVNGSEFVFNFYSTIADNSQFDVIFESQYKDYRVSVYEVDTSNILIWRGYVKPENFSREFIKDSYYLTLQAVDGLADLKNIEYEPSTTNHISILQIIKECLSYTQIELDFHVQVNQYPAQILSTSCALKELTATPRRFEKQKDGYTYYDNCYNVISALLKPFNSKLSQINGVYLITNTKEIDSYIHHFEFNLSYNGRIANNRTENIDNYDFFSRGELSKIAPVKRLNLTFQNKNLGENILPDLNLWGITGWTNYSYTANSFEMIEISTSSSPSTRYIQSPSFFVERLTDNDKIKMFYNFHYEHSNNSYIDYPRLKVQYRIGGGEWQDAHVGQYIHRFVISNEIEIPIQSTNNYQVRLEIYYFSLIPHFLNINNITSATVYDGNENITTDKLYIAVNQNSTAVNVEESILLFGDTLQENDIAIFKYNNDNVSGWTRYNKTENKSLQEIYIQDYLNNYNLFKNYLRLEIYDKNDNITYHDVIQIQNKYYQFVSFEKDFKNNRISGELVEILITDITLYINENVLTSVDGESTEQPKNITNNDSIINDVTQSYTTTYSSNKIETCLSAIDQTPSLQEVTDADNTTNNTIILKSPDNCKSICLSTNNAGNLIISGGDLHTTGNMIAYSASASTPASWWNELSNHVDCDTICYTNDKLTVSPDFQPGTSVSDVINIVNNCSSIDAYNAKRLDNHSASYFSPATHNHNGTYLGITATACNSDKLDNHDSTYFYNPANFNKSDVDFTANDITATGFVKIGDAVGSAAGDLGVRGNLRVGGNITTGYLYISKNNINTSDNTDITIDENTNIGGNLTATGPIIANSVGDGVTSLLGPTVEINRNSAGYLYKRGTTGNLFLSVGNSGSPHADG